MNSNGTAAPIRYIRSNKTVLFNYDIHDDIFKPIFAFLKVCGIYRWTFTHDRTIKFTVLMKTMCIFIFFTYITSNCLVLISYTHCVCISCWQRDMAQYLSECLVFILSTFFPILLRLKIQSLQNVVKIIKRFLSQQTDISDMSFLKVKKFILGSQ